MKPYFERINEDTYNLERLNGFQDRTIYQTQEWLKFIARTQNAEPLIAALRQRNHTLGFFTGLIVNKFGIKILGSPFKGWTTGYMGFNLLPNVSRQIALEALRYFAFNDLKCHHFEIMDRNMTFEDCSKFNFDIQTENSFEIDLTKSEEDLLANMDKKSCRWCIRKSEKCGVIIEEAHDMNFADDYYAQLKDVFAKQSLIPTYSIERVRELIRDIYPTGNLLLLRAKNSSGICIATGIFPAFNDTMYFWGGASWRQYQNLRPNEAIVWYAMKYWKKRGIEKFDFGGAGEYKRKYGGYRIKIPWVRMSKYKIIGSMRNFAKYLISIHQKASGYCFNRKNENY